MLVVAVRWRVDAVASANLSRRYGEVRALTAPDRRQPVEARAASRQAKEAGHTADTLRDRLDVAEARAEAAQRDAQTAQEA